MTITDSGLTGFRPDSWPAANELATPTDQPRTARVYVSNRASTPTWLPYVLQRLRDLQTLAGEPADEIPAPHPEAIERALPELLLFMRFETPTPSVVPTFDGSVQFVWHKAGWDVEVEVGPKETLAWAQPRGGDSSMHGSLEDHLDGIRRVLANMSAARPA